MIIITGAAGFIGSCLVSKLNEERYFDLVLVGEKGRMFFGRSRQDWVFRPETITVKEILGEQNAELRREIPEIDATLGTGQDEHRRLASLVAVLPLCCLACPRSATISLRAPIR